MPIGVYVSVCACVYVCVQEDNEPMILPMTTWYVQGHEGTGLGVYACACVCTCVPSYEHMCPRAHTP